MEPRYLGPSLEKRSPSNRLGQTIGSVNLFCWVKTGLMSEWHPSIVVVTNIAKAPWEVVYYTICGLIAGAVTTPASCRKPILKNRKYNLVKFTDVVERLGSFSAPAFTIINKSDGLPFQACGTSLPDGQSLGQGETTKQLFDQIRVFIDQKFPERHTHQKSTGRCYRSLIACPCYNCSGPDDDSSNWVKESPSSEVQYDVLWTTCTHCRIAEDSPTGLGRFIKCFNYLLEGRDFFGESILIPGVPAMKCHTSRNPNFGDGQEELNFLAAWATKHADKDSTATSLQIMSPEDIWIYGSLRTSAYFARVLHSHKPPTFLNCWVSRVTDGNHQLHILTETLHQAGTSQWRQGLQIPASVSVADSLVERDEFCQGDRAASAQPISSNLHVVFPSFLAGTCPPSSLPPLHLPTDLVLGRCRVPIEGPVPVTPKRIARSRRANEKREAGRPIVRQLICAIKEVDFPTVRKILESGEATVDEKDFDSPNEVQLAHVAASLCQTVPKFQSLGRVKPHAFPCKNLTHVTHDACPGVAMMKLLHSFGADLVTAKDNENMCPLFFAAFSGCVKCTEFLVESGTDVDVMDDQGRTPLYWAACGGKTTTTQWLLENGADVNNASCIQRTAISKAAWSDEPEIVKLLLKFGASPMVLDCKGRTPLHTAVWGAQGGRRGHKIVAGGLAAESVGCMEILLSHPEGPKALNLFDKDGAMPLHIAASTGGSLCIPHLVAAGAHVNGRSRASLMTPLMCAAYRGVKHSIEALLKCGGDLLLKDVRGYDSFCYAIQVIDEEGGQAETLRFLLTSFTLEKDHLKHLLKLCCRELQTACLEILLAQWPDDDDDDIPSDLWDQTLCCSHEQPVSFQPLLQISSQSGKSLPWPPFKEPLDVAEVMCVQQHQESHTKLCFCVASNLKKKSGSGCGHKIDYLRQHIIDCHDVLLKAGKIGRQISKFFLSSLTRMTGAMSYQRKQGQFDAYPLLRFREYSEVFFDYTISTACLFWMPKLLEILLKHAAAESIMTWSESIQGRSILCMGLTSAVAHSPTPDPVTYARQKEVVSLLLEYGANPLWVPASVKRISRLGQVELTWYMVNACRGLNEELVVFTKNLLDLSWKAGYSDLCLLLEEKLKEYENAGELEEQLTGMCQVHQSSSTCYQVLNVVITKDDLPLRENPHIKVVEDIILEAEKIPSVVTREIKYAQSLLINDENAAELPSSFYLENVAVISDEESLIRAIDTIVSKFLAPDPPVYLGVDVEYHAFQGCALGVVCLVQLSLGHSDYTAVIDVLQAGDRNVLSFQLRRILEDPTIVKVVHGSSNDLQWLASCLDVYVVQMIDTYRAANLLASSARFLKDSLCVGVNNTDSNRLNRFEAFSHNCVVIRKIKSAVEDVVGINDGLRIEIIAQSFFNRMIAVSSSSKSLKALAEIYLNLKIKKSFQRSDWRIRPIPDEMLAYAATDAWVLPLLSSMLLADLELLSAIEGSSEKLPPIQVLIAESNRSTMKLGKEKLKRILYEIR